MSKVLNRKQAVYRELFVGTLIYAVVLGFFNDYTNIVDAKSFSTIFFASIVLEILTLGVFGLKKRVVKNQKKSSGETNWWLLVFSVWMIMFLSKFVFIWVIDLLFGNYISINGFFGILIVVLTVTAINKLSDMVFEALAD